MRTFLVAALVLFLLILAVALGAQNEGQVSVNYLIAQSQVAVSTLMAVCFLIGVALTLVFTLWQSLRLNWRIKSLEKQVKQADGQ